MSPLFNNLLSAIVVEHQDVTNDSDSGEEVHLEEVDDKVFV